jgi:hypothetical protein
LARDRRAIGIAARGIDEGKMKGFIIIGAVLAALGIIGLAQPMFTTSHTEEVAKIGDLHIDAKKQDTHFVPPLVSGGAVVLGALLLGAGLMKR